MTQRGETNIVYIQINGINLQFFVIVRKFFRIIILIDDVSGKHPGSITVIIFNICYLQYKQHQCLEILST